MRSLRLLLGLRPAAKTVYLDEIIIVNIHEYYLDNLYSMLRFAQG